MRGCCGAKRYLEPVRGNERIRPAAAAIVVMWSIRRKGRYMNVVQDYRNVMLCSAGWLGPLSSPLVALTASKIAGALCTFLLR